MTAAKKRGKSALSRHLAQRTAERTQPNASASSPTMTAPEPAPEAATVGKARKARKTKMDAFLDQIGVLPDSEIAALAGVTVTNVYGYRLRHGIPAPPRRVKSAVEPANKPMAAESVAVEPVAVEIPVPVPEPTGVQVIPEVEPEPAARPATRAKWQEIAGTSIQVVRRSRLDAYVDKIGVVSDAEVARMAGVTRARVYLWRRRRGIPPARDARSAAPVVEVPAPVQPVTEPAQAAPVEAPVPVPVPVIEEPEHVEPVPPAGKAARTIRLTDRVEAMLQALAKARGIDLDAAIAVAIAEDYMRCRAIIRSE